MALDAITITTCALVVALVVHGMFFKVVGGGLPLDGWFGWHPVLMSLSFGCLMPLGRLAYISEPSLLGLHSLQKRRRLHRLLMLLATAALIAGYLCIFKAHWPGRKFFGYDFKQGEWAEWKRVAHSWLGYVAILLSLSQAAMGLVKLQYLALGERRFTFHGLLGKAIMSVSLVAILLAVWFWKWSLVRKLLLVALIVMIALFGVWRPRTPAAASSSSDNGGTESSEPNESTGLQ